MGVSSPANFREILSFQLYFVLFRCTGSPQCLPISWRCDGDFDCPNEEDEKNCEGTTCHDWQFDCGGKY